MLQKNLLLISFLFLIAPNLRAQQKADSLRKLLPGLSQDTTRVQVLNDLAYELVFSEPAESEKLAAEAIELAQRLKYKKGEAKGYQIAGITFDIRGEYNQAIEHLTKGMEVVQQMDTASLAVKELSTSLLNVLGLAYYHQSEYQQALRYFLDARRILETVQNPARLANIYNNIGLVYHDQKESDHALEFYLKALDLATQAGSKNIAGRAANNIGLIYKDKGDLEKSLAYYIRSLAFKREVGDDNGLGATFQNVAVIHKRKGDLKKAWTYLDSAAYYKNRVDDKLGLVQTNDTRAEILILQSRYPEAESLIKTNQALVNKLGAREPMLLVYERFLDLEKSKGNFQKALSWYEKRTALNDSLFNETKSKQLAELEAKYELDKKEKEIESLENEKALQLLKQRFLLVLSGVLVALLGFIVYFFVHKQKQNRKFFQTQQALSKAELVNAQLREEELKKELEFKNRELTSYTVNFIQKSKLMEEMKETLTSLRTESPTDVSKKIQSMQRIIDSNYQIDREWEDFKMHFEQVHPEFFEQLKASYPELTPSDLKLCALLKLNMNTKESAKILGISPDSVKTARYRLRKKLQLRKEEGLFDFIYRIEGDTAEVD